MFSCVFSLKKPVVRFSDRNCRRQPPKNQRVSFPGIPVASLGIPQGCNISAISGSYIVTWHRQGNPPS